MVGTRLPYTHSVHHYLPLDGACIYVVCANATGQIKVGDRGLGRLLPERDAEEALAHSMVGTPLYMAPEVLRGRGYSWKSDVWSLGCILYELAMLRNPFKCESLSLSTLVKKINKVRVTRQSAMVGFLHGVVAVVGGGTHVS